MAANHILYKLPEDEEENKLLEDLVLRALDNKDAREEKEFDFSDNPNIYHYTSPVGFKEIIAHHSLWFTHYRFLNDRSEKYYTFDLFRECLEEEKELKPTFYKSIIDLICINDNLKYDLFYDKVNDFPDYYVASFSLNNNSLSMWNYYTKTNNKIGYNIDFESEKLIESLKNKSYNFYKVNYNKEVQRIEIKRYINIFNNAWDDSKSELFLFWLKYLLLDLIDSISLRYKHPAFASEEEFRIVYKINDLNRDKIEAENLLMFRESNGIIVPYLNIGFEKTCINGIKISPTQQDSIAKEGVLMMLKNKGYNNLAEKSITASDIPLRN